MLYYFASKHNYDRETLMPRIPLHKFNKEDNIVERICVSQSIHGCLSAIGCRFKVGDIVYIHICESHNAVQPTIEQVGDVCLTGEQWILEPVEMKLFMKIEITGVTNTTIGNMDNAVCLFKLAE